MRNFHFCELSGFLEEKNFYDRIDTRIGKISTGTKKKRNVEMKLLKNSELCSAVRKMFEI